jgi:hypothetical protein
MFQVGYEHDIMCIVGLWTWHNFGMKIRLRVSIKSMQLIIFVVCMADLMKFDSEVVQDTELKQWTVAFCDEIWPVALLNCSYISTAASQYCF